MALVRVLLSRSSGRSVISPSFRVSSDSLGVMYGARFPLRDFAGYHRETMSSLAFTLGTQGSAREVSLRYRETVPIGWDPVGLGMYGVPIRVDGGSAGADEVEPGDGRREGASDTAGLDADAEAQEVAATKASRAATAVAPRPMRRAGVDLPAPVPCPEAGVSRPIT